MPLTHRNREHLAIDANQKVEKQFWTTMGQAENSTEQLISSIQKRLASISENINQIEHSLLDFKKVLENSKSVALNRTMKDHRERELLSTKKAIADFEFTKLKDWFSGLSMDQMMTLEHWIERHRAQINSSKFSKEEVNMSLDIVLAMNDGRVNVRDVFSGEADQKAFTTMASEKDDRA